MTSPRRPPSTQLDPSAPSARYRSRPGVVPETRDARGVPAFATYPLPASGRSSAIAQRRASGRLLNAVWEVFPEHVALLDRDGTVVSVNRAWREFGLQRGSSATAGLGTNYLQVCERAAAEGDAEAADAAEIVRIALAGSDPGRRVTYHCGHETEDRWFSMQAVPVPGRYSGALVVHTDITIERRRERDWQYRALHDQLTGLPNRTLLMDRLQHAVATAARGARSVAVLFVDLDSFKTVNDTFGHPAGDRVLAETARRMAKSVRASDTIARWGGDEFVVIAEGLDYATTAADVADRIRASLTEPILVGRSRIRVQASVGSCYFEGDQEADHLIAAANTDLQALRQRCPAERRVVGL